VIDDENIFLIKCSDLNEVKHAVFSLNVDIALGPYDFDGYFHHYFWDIIGIYVLKLSNNSFSRFVSFFIQI